MMKPLRIISIFIFSLSFSVLSHAGGIQSDIDTSTLRADKKTPLGLYLSSRAAYEILKANPNILFIDVRDPVEIALTGHPDPVDQIIPVRTHSDEFDTEVSEYRLVHNLKFIEQVTTTVKEMNKSKYDVIFITCGSGVRSAEAVRLLANAGYSNVWHITDGYDGDDKPGFNEQNAWLNDNLPWSKKLVHNTPWVLTPSLRLE